MQQRSFSWRYMLRPVVLGLLALSFSGCAIYDGYGPYSYGTSYQLGVGFGHGFDKANVAISLGGLFPFFYGRPYYYRPYGHYGYRRPYGYYGGYHYKPWRRGYHYHR